MNRITEEALRERMEYWRTKAKEASAEDVVEEYAQRAEICAELLERRSTPEPTRRGTYKIVWNYPASPKQSEYIARAQDADDAIRMWKIKYYLRGAHPTNQPEVLDIELID